MTNLVIAPIQQVTLKELVRRTLASIPNANTKQGYHYALRRFTRSKLPLTRAGVLDLLEGITAPSMKSMAVNAIRKLAREAEMAGFISAQELRGIEAVKAPAHEQTRLGVWLSLEGCQRLLKLPNPNSLKGSRDLAMFALLLGCGLRRYEAVTVSWEQYRIVEGRAVLVDIRGKGDKIRSVPVPEWGREAIDNWRNLLTVRLGQLGLDPEMADEGPILRSAKWIDPSHPLTEFGVAKLVRGYSRTMDTHFAAHDLRRTLAQLMRRAGAPIEQIQFTLGHSGVKTTERYLGGGIELAEGKAAVDLIEWEKRK